MRLLRMKGFFALGIKRKRPLSFGKADISPARGEIGAIF
jgi:hypothetical protein